MGIRGYPWLILNFKKKLYKKYAFFYRNKKKKTWDEQMDKYIAQLNISSLFLYSPLTKHYVKISINNEK